MIRWLQCNVKVRLLNQMQCCCSFRLICVGIRHTGVCVASTRWIVNDSAVIAAVVVVSHIHVSFALFTFVTFFSNQKRKYRMYRIGIFQLKKTYFVFVVAYLELKWNYKQASHRSKWRETKMVVLGQSMYVCVHMYGLVDVNSRQCMHSIRPHKREKNDAKVKHWIHQHFTTETQRFDSQLMWVWKCDLCILKIKLRQTYVAFVSISQIT